MYIVKYVGGQGYWYDGEWHDGSSIEGKTTSPEFWLKKHNRNRVGEQCTDTQYEMYMKGKGDEELAIAYAMKKLGLSRDDAEYEWMEIESVIEYEHEFEFIWIS